MDVGVSDLVDELKVLRKGYGIESTDVPARVGTALRLVCGVSPDDSPGTVRRKVATVLAALTDGLPEELRLLGRAALGIEGKSSGRYQKRVKLLADHLGRDPRTVQRRIDDVFKRIAELALDSSPDRVTADEERSWHTVRLSASMMLDQPVAEVIECRRIVAHRRLTEIENSITLTPPHDWNGDLDPAELGIDVVRGGLLHGHHLWAPHRLGFSLRLPHALEPGDEHEFVLRTRVTRDFAPHFVCTPDHPCSRFELTIRFGPDRVPARIWLLSNVFPLELEDPWPERALIEADAAGEVRAEFTDLESHRSYGIGWESRPA